MFTGPLMSVNGHDIQVRDKIFHSFFKCFIFIVFMFKLFIYRAAQLGQKRLICSFCHIM